MAQCPRIPSLWWPWVDSTLRNPDIQNGKLFMKNSFTLESHHRIFNKCIWNARFQVQNYNPLTALQEHSSCITRTLHKAQPLMAAERPIWEITPEPLQTNSLWWLGCHWAPASSFAVSIFHRCSLVSSNFRIFFKWFSSCQLGTVQGIQLEGLSRMDQSKTACQPDLDWTGLFEPCPEVGIPPVFLSYWFPSFPFPNPILLLLW